MTFEELWPTLVIPGEFDSMDQCDQDRWRGVIRQAYEAGVGETARRCAEIASDAAKDIRKYGDQAVVESIRSTFPEAFK